MRLLVYESRTRRKIPPRKQGMEIREKFLRRSNLALTYFRLTPASGLDTESFAASSAPLMRHSFFLEPHRNHVRPVAAGGEKPQIVGKDFADVFRNHSASPLELLNEPVLEANALNQL